MPTYSFRDIETGEEFDKFLSISGKETFLTENPNLIQIISQPPSLGYDSVALGARRTDSGFNDLMNRIGKANPGSAVAERYVSKTAKEAKVDAVAKKHGLRKG